MHMNQYHFIDKKILDVVYSNEKNAHQLQNRLSSLSGGALSLAISEVLDKFGANNDTIRLDQLELNIGHVPEDDLENEVVERVKEELTKLLSERIRLLKPIQTGRKEGVVTDQYGQVELLTWFLANGTLPWWKKDRKNVQLKSSIDSLMLNHPDKIASMVKKHHRSGRFLERLVLHFNDDQLFSLVQKLEPTEAQLIIDTGKNTLLVQEKNSLVKTDRHTFRNKVWEFILTYLMNDRGSDFNTRSFVHSLLFRLSGHFNVQFGTFITQFKDAVLLLGKQLNLRHSLPEIIMEIYSKEVEVKKQKQGHVDIELEKEWLFRLFTLENVQLNQADKVKAKIIMEQLLDEQHPGLKEVLMTKMSAAETANWINELAISSKARHHVDKLTMSSYGITVKPTEKQLLRIKSDWIHLVIDRMEYPWWGEKHKLYPNQFQGILTELSAAMPSELMKTLIELFPQHKKRKLALSRLDEKGKIRLIELIQPAQKESIRFYLSALNKLQQKEVTPALNFNEQKWDVVILALIKDRGSFFNMKSFMLTTLHQIAHHFNVEFEELFGNFIALSKTLPGIAGTPFMRAISELKSEHQTQLATTLKVDKKQLTKAEKAWEKTGIERKKNLKPLFLWLYDFKEHTNWVFTRKDEMMKWMAKNNFYSSTDLIALFRTIGFKPFELDLLFRQFNKREQHVWLQALTREDALFMPYYHTDFNHLLAALPGLPKSNCQQIILAFSLSYLVSEEKPDKHIYFRELLQTILNAWGLKWEDLAQSLEKALAQHKDKYTSTLPLSFAKMKAHRAETSNLPKELIKKKTEPTDTAQLKNTTEREIIKEKIDDEPKDVVLVTNAGIVLLWPFLTQYFQRLDLLDDHQFKGKKEAVRAVHLLQYVVTGKENHPEYDLYLNKLLCGIPPGTPIESEIDLTDKEKEISDSLLGGVIANWTSMEDTSPEALRETFLQRNGTIRFGEDSIELRVEHKTVDILLDSLPWGYAVVQFPWLKKIIRVIWK